MLKEKLKKNKIIANILLVGISNIIKLLAGIFVGFLIPKLMGETNYGLYKTYTLYAGYVGVLSLGFVDGVYLIFAGLDENKLNKDVFRTLSKFYIGFQLIISLLIITIGVIFITSDIGFLIIALGLTLLFSNINGYYQHIAQITKEFKKYSKKILLESIFQVVVILIFTLLWYLKVISILEYKLYVVARIFILAILSIIYIVSYRNLTFGKSLKLSEVKGTIKQIFIVGFPLMIANFVSSLILSIDKQFVNVLSNFGIYSIAEFGIYSFAYTMLNIIVTVISAISTVLYPTIKTMSNDKLKYNYNRFISIIIIITGACLLSYQPLCFIVEHWLKNYASSLQIFRAILPGIVISSCVTVIMYNYYKALGKHVKFFIISAIVLVLSIAADFIAFFSTKEMVWISLASVIVIAIWYLLSDYFICKKLKTNSIKNTLYMISLISSFYLITYFISNIYISFCVYFVVFLTLTFSFNFTLIKNKFKLEKNIETFSNSIETNDDGNNNK